MCNTKEVECRFRPEVPAQQAFGSGFGMEVLTTSEMERADHLTIAAGKPGFALMLSAGQAVAEAAMELAEEGPIVVVAGRGNNGGHGRWRFTGKRRSAPTQGRQCKERRKKRRERNAPSIGGCTRKRRDFE